MSGSAPLRPAPTTAAAALRSAAATPRVGTGAPPRNAPAARRRGIHGERVVRPAGAASLWAALRLHRPHDPPPGAPLANRPPSGPRALRARLSPQRTACSFVWPGRTGLCGGSPRGMGADDVTPRRAIGCAGESQARGAAAPSAERRRQERFLAGKRGEGPAAQRRTAQRGAQRAGHTTSVAQVAWGTHNQAKSQRRVRCPSCPCSSCLGRALGLAEPALDRGAIYMPQYEERSARRRDEVCASNRGEMKKQ